MRRIFLFTLALIAVLVACTGLLLLRPSLWREAAARIGVAPVATPSPGERDSPFATPPPTAPSKVPTKLAASPSSDEREPATPQSAPPAPVKYLFPIATAINVGTSKSDVIAAFGLPAATVTGADVGRLNERIIYLDRAAQKKTVITIVNGKVASSATYVGEAMQD
jgi:hypothetical protein